MATTLYQPMSHATPSLSQPEPPPNGHDYANLTSHRTMKYPGNGSLTKEEQQRALAAAALASVGTSISGSASASGSGPASDSEDSQQEGRHAQVMTRVVGASSNGSQESWATQDTSQRSVGGVGFRKSQEVGGHVEGEQRPYTPVGQIMRGVEEPVVVKSLHESPPLKQGAKRTASGAVKDMGVGMGNGLFSPRVGDDYAAGVGRRPKSNSKAAEISAQLKTQLAYAMVKVNNGWENHNLSQLEHISASRISTPSISSPSTTSPHRRRLSMHSEYNADRYITSPHTQMSPTSHFSPRFVPGHSNNTHYTNHHPTASYTTGPPSSSFALQQQMNIPSLAPAAPIHTSYSSHHRRSQSLRAPPSLNTTSSPYQAHQRTTSSTTTTTPRQGILRMPSQQAEKDALDSLLFMASPGNSANLKYTDTGPAGPSPLRSEFPGEVFAGGGMGKRVVFEGEGR